MSNKQNSRRDFFKKASLSGLAVFISSRFSFGSEPSAAANTSLSLAISKLGEYQLTGLSKQNPLPYAYTDLEPSIDAKTMEIHYSKHHAAYTKNMMKCLSAQTVNPNHFSSSLLKSRNTPFR